jgi:hypothetical protein
METKRNWTDRKLFATVVQPNEFNVDYLKGLKKLVKTSVLWKLELEMIENKILDLLNENIDSSEITIAETISQKTLDILKKRGFDVELLKVSISLPSGQLGSEIVTCIKW